MIFADIQPETVAIFIPFVVIIGGIVIAVVGIISTARSKDLKHRERILAMEKGLPIPEEPQPEEKPAYATRRAWGITMTLVGLAVTIGIGAEDGWNSAAWGLIPTALGVGLFIAAILDKREYDARAEARRAERNLGG